LVAPFLLLLPLLLLLHPTAPILLPFPSQQQEKDKQQEAAEEEADNVLQKGQEFSFWICLQENERMGGWALAGPSSSCTSLVLVHDIAFYLPLHVSRDNRRKELLLLLPVLL
jgi:hypothetical protein